MAEVFKEDKKTVAMDFLGTIILIMYLVAVGYIVFGFLSAGRALENPDNIKKFWTYLVLGIISVLLIFASKFENLIMVYLNLKSRLDSAIINFFEAFDTFVHQTRDSILENYFGKLWWLNPFDLGLFTLAISSTIGLFIVISKTPLTQVYTFLFEQQISPTAEFGLAIEPAVFGETMSLMALAGILWGISKYLVNKRYISITTHYFITIGIIPVICAFLWMGIHLLVYGDNSFGLLATWFWGYAQVLSAMIFVSVIPAYIFHAVNNAFQKASEMFSAEITVIMVALIVLLLWVSVTVRISIHYGKRTRT